MDELSLLELSTCKQSLLLSQKPFGLSLRTKPGFLNRGYYSTKRRGGKDDEFAISAWMCYNQYLGKLVECGRKSAIARPVAGSRLHSRAPILKH
jgi:hypothetical protein